MSAFYEQLRAEAGQLLADLGRDIIFRRHSYTNDIVEGTTLPTLVGEQTLKGATLPASGGTLEAFDVRFMGDVKDETNVRFAIVSAEGASFMPGPGDQAEFGGMTWNVMGCTPLDVDGTAVIYSIGFREE